MTADTTRREHSGSGIRLGIGSCPGIAKILPAGIRGITLPEKFTGQPGSEWSSISPSPS